MGSQKIWESYQIWGKIFEKTLDIQAEIGYTIYVR